MLSTGARNLLPLGPLQEKTCRHHHFALHGPPPTAPRKTNKQTNKRGIDRGDKNEKNRDTARWAATKKTGIHIAVSHDGQLRTPRGASRLRRSNCLLAAPDRQGEDGLNRHSHGSAQGNQRQKEAPIRYYHKSFSKARTVEIYCVDISCAAHCDGKNNRAPARTLSKIAPASTLFCLGVCT